MDQLPPEIINEIFLKLDQKSLFTVSWVCRQWRDIVQHPSVWWRVKYNPKMRKSPRKKWHIFRRKKAKSRIFDQSVQPIKYFDANGEKIINLKITDDYKIPPSTQLPKVRIYHGPADYLTNMRPSWYNIHSLVLEFTGSISIPTDIDLPHLYYVQMINANTIQMMIFFGKVKSMTQIVILTLSS